MMYKSQVGVLIVLLIFMIMSCSPFSKTRNPSQEINSEEVHTINQLQAIDNVWVALEPNTSSHNRSNWQVEEAQLVPGESVSEHFEGEPAPDCWFGPEPVKNKIVSSTKTYWFVLMTPNPVTPVPSYSTPSPTAPPQIPEPFLKYAYFLVDSESGEIMARKLICVIY